MTSWLFNDSSDSHQVLDGEVEKYKWHWLIHIIIVLYQMFISCHLKLILVNDFFVTSINVTELAINITPGETSELIDSLNLAILIGIEVTEYGIK